jgi:hypothetical protein
MKLDTDPFPVGMVELEHKKILVRMDQAETTKGKNVVISDDVRNQMIKSHNLKIGVWKENMQRKPTKRVNPHWLCWMKNISCSWRKTGGTGSPEGSNGIDSLRPGTNPIYRKRGVVGNPEEGRCNTLHIVNPG